MASVLSFKDVSKSYKRGKESVAVLDLFNLEIAENDFVAIMGPSGSGKTTLLNLIGGLDRPSGGEITVAGERLDQLSGSALANWRARHVGFIFQFYNLMPTLSAKRNVELPLLLTPLSAGERKRKVEAALELVGLSDRSKHTPGELSGGQQQRVAIARALIADPCTLVVYQPTGSRVRHAAPGVWGCGERRSRRYGEVVTLGSSCRNPTQRVVADAIDPDPTWVQYPGLAVSKTDLEAMAHKRNGALANVTLVRKYSWKVGDLISLKSGLLQKNGSPDWTFEVLGTFAETEHLGL